MRYHRGNGVGSQAIIEEIGYTEDVLTSRGGLALFVRYLRGIDVLPHMPRLFGGLRGSRKGAGINELFKQLICHFVDGTSRHVTRFDELQGDCGYAGSIETEVRDLVSSHTVKRFLRKMW